MSSEVFTSVLQANDMRISMDGKGRWVDNVFLERLWRSLKYEEVYLKAYDNIAQACASIGRYMAFFNAERRHQSLGCKTPDTVYFGLVDQRRAA
jgi:putative transposase